MASISGNQEIARRYATAFFALAQEQNQLDVIAGDLELIGALTVESEDFNTLATNTMLKRADQTRALLAIANAIKISDLTKKFLGMIAEKRRLPILANIVQAAQDLLAVHRGEVTAEVVSVEPLDDAAVGKIAQSLSQALGLTVKINTVQDPAIMGGLVVRVGSKLIDSSVRAKLDKLALQLETQGSPRGQEKKMREVA